MKHFARVRRLPAIMYFQSTDDKKKKVKQSKGGKEMAWSIPLKRWRHREQTKKTACLLASKYYSLFFVSFKFSVEWNIT